MITDTMGTSMHSGGQESTFQQLKASLHEQLISELDFSAMHSMDPDVVRTELRRGAERLCGMHSELLSQRDRTLLIDELLNEMMGLGPLEPVMQDPSVTDILVNGPNCVYVERRGKLEPTSIKFRDLDHLVEIVQRIAARVGRRVDEANPMVDARLYDGSRLNAIIHPLALDGALVSIRRFSNRPFTPQDLVARQSTCPQMMEFLAACVATRLNVVVSGGTGSGKTTLLNVLSGFIPNDQRIVTIEDAAELQLQQPHVARVETRPSSLEGKGEVTSRELLRNALRMRPDRIIVGECRGPEAFDMLQALNTGHDGGMSTIHANNSRDALSRLEMLVGMAAPELPMWFIHRQIAEAIDIVVQVSRLSDGSRRITQVSEVTGIHGESLSMHDVFRFQQTGFEENKVQGSFEATGIQPECLEKIKACGIQLSPKIFETGGCPVERLDGLRGM